MQSSGKQSTAQQRTGVQFSGTQFTNIGARLAQLRQGAGGASFAGLDLGMPTGNGLGEFFSMLQDMTGFKGLSAVNVGGSGGEESPDAVTLSRWGFFINGTLRGGSQDTTINETGFDFRSNGITAGADYRLRENLVLGLALGHSNGNTRFTDGTGRLDSRGQLCIPLRHLLQGRAVRRCDRYIRPRQLRCGADDSLQYRSKQHDHPHQLHRRPMLDRRGLDRRARGRWAFATNVGYGFHYRGLAFGPDAALNYPRVDVNGFAESDPSQTGMALAFSDQTGRIAAAECGADTFPTHSTPALPSSCRKPGHTTSMSSRMTSALRPCTSSTTPTWGHRTGPSATS